MPCGLFGKLPLKRDFVAVHTPREFLMQWEQWLQGGVSASKIALAGDFLPNYLSAPLWRFWLGADICGLPVAGAFMSSVDGVGRHFPLTVFECGAAADLFAPPGDAGNDQWFVKVEDFLLSCLDPEADYTALLAELDLLPLCAKSPAPGPNAAIVAHRGALAARAADVDGVGDAFTAVNAERDRARLLKCSFWWTIGGESFEPAVIVADGLPDPNLLSAMLTGNFARGGDES